MAALYPGGFDSSFPGYPYMDNTEFVLAAYANSWVLAIQAIESTIGYGSGTSPLNPLYSQAYNTTFSTITARLANVESTVISSIGLDQSSADIQPVGTAANAGNSGKAAASNHVHVGVASFNGRTGAVTPTAADFGIAYTAAGQIIVGIGNNASGALALGATGTVLTVGAGGTGGLVWGTSPWSAGDLKFSSTTTIPTGWAQANGQALTRSSFPTLLANSTISGSGTSSGGQQISGVSNSLINFLTAGMPIEGNGIPAGTTITGLSNNVISVSQNVSSGTVNFQIFPYGNGNGSTTFNVINMSGKMPVGIGGNGLNASPQYFMGQSGGEQLHALAVSELAQHTHTFTTGIENAAHTHSGGTGQETPGHQHTLEFPSGQFFGSYAGSAAGLAYGGPVGTGIYNTPATLSNVETDFESQAHTHSFTTNGENQNHAHGGTSDNTGSSGGHNNMSPYTAGIWLVKTT